MTASTVRLLHEELRLAAEEEADAPLVTFIDDRTYTRGELYDGMLCVAAALQQAGVRPGDRVALFLRNQVQYLTSWLGAAAAGAVAVPLNTAMQGDVLTHMLSLTEPVILIAGAEYEDQLRPSLASAAYQTRFVWVGDTIPSDGVSFDDFLTAQAAEPVDAKKSDLVGIFFTSGTTGPSKGVMWCHETAFAMADGALHVMDYRADDVLFTTLPLFHANALFTSFLPALMRRARLVVAERFSASRFWEEVCEHEATTVNMLGSMEPILWRQPLSDFERAHKLRIALVVPSLPVDHDEEFEHRFGVRSTSLYGLTDSSIPIGVPAGQTRAGSCGVAVAGWECQLVDEDDEVVPVGTPGELVLRPQKPYIGQLGYWRMPEATVAAWRNLWFHTGDLMRQDADGWFYFLDRSKDAIRRSGENISSFEVEQVLLSHPEVQDAAVYAVPSELSEDEVMASVVLAEGGTATAPDLVAWCEPRLPYFAVPRYVDLRTSLPMTTTQKVQKQVLRRQGVTTTAYDRGPGGRNALRQRSG